MKNIITIRYYTQFLFVLAAIFFVSASGNLQAQTFDTKGTDFIMVFMPNFHAFAYMGDADSVYIYISAEEETDIKINIKSLSTGVKVIKYHIADPGQMYKFGFTWNGHELNSGYTGSWKMDNTLTPTDLSVRITSTKEINVYGLSSALRSSDAFLVLPTDVLNDEYYVLSYFADEYNSSYGKPDNSSYTPSQFAIVANEDNTNVTITPTAKTTTGRPAGVPYSVVLNAGQSYLVCTDTANGINADFSGTYIKGDKPFALFAGQQRATIPHDLRIDNINAESASRDFICSQIPPVTTWGRNAFVIPFPQYKSIQKPDYYHDRYRVLSSADNNVIDINGTKKILNKGEWLEDDILNTALNISASQPILVAQYKRTCSFLPYTDFIHSDPLFLVIPPKEQFIKSCKLMNMDKASTESGEKTTFTEQYVFIVAPNQAACILDGDTIPASAFTAIQNSNYSYSIRTVTAGIHDFSSKEKCGLYIVGYGYANSYGYVGGMAMRNINDTLPPSITTEKSCWHHLCKISDDAGETDGVQSISLMSSDNVNVNIPGDVEGKTDISFAADLIDQSRDGTFSLKVVDMHNNSRIFNDTIQGNTLSLNYSDGVENNLDSTVIGTRNCGNVILQNSGILPWNLDGDFFFRHGVYFSIPRSQFPLTIAPGESKNLTFCALPQEVVKTKPILFDTLDLNFGCYGLSLPVSVIPQKIIRGGESKCGLPVSITISSTVNTLVFDEITYTANRTASFTYGIPGDGNIEISIFDINGNIVDTAFKGYAKAGLYELDYNYSRLTSGVYLVRILQSSGSISQKMIICN